MMLERIFDDAALFPPGNAAMPDAVRAHLARRDTSDGAWVGPFVCPVERLDELAQTLAQTHEGHDAGRDLELAVVGLPGADLPAGVALTAVELSGPVEARPDLPAHVRVFVERSWDADVDVPAGTLLKLRCGGAYVPSACQLAMAICTCVQRDEPFKLTAGLHHAMRTDHEHGLLNVLAAVDAALRGSGPVPMLLTDDPGSIRIDDPAGARRLLLSIGTCSIDEPLDGLRKLGWAP